jgi:hypothetical protein
MTPFYKNTGYHPWKGIENNVESRNKSAEEFAEKMKKIHDNATAAPENTKSRKRIMTKGEMHQISRLEIKSVEGTDIEQDRSSEKFSD